MEANFVKGNLKFSNIMPYYIRGFFVSKYNYFDFDLNNIILFLRPTSQTIFLHTILR